MTLASQLSADIETVFINTNDFGVSISYQRGTASVSFTALVSSTVFESEASFGITRTETRDYSFVPSRLILGSAVKLPERGDVIVEGGRKYIVTEPVGQPCYQYDDENRLMMRVHTTMIKDA
jgi:hypothetical protein